jgi:mRNA interferase MazF
MNRGEVRWYNFRPPDKRRPVLILTRDSVIEYLNAVTVAPITTTIRDIPSEVFLSQGDGLHADCAVNLDHLQTVPKSQIGELISILSPGRMDEVKDSVLFALGFDTMLF